MRDLGSENHDHNNSHGGNSDEVHRKTIQDKTNPRNRSTKRWIIVGLSVILLIIASCTTYLLVMFAPWKKTNSETNNGIAPLDLPDNNTATTTESYAADTGNPKQQYTQPGKCKKLETIPHDASAFTQGLLTITDRSDGTLKLYEGTGMYGQSELRLLDQLQGTVLDRHRLPSKYFGEGIAHFPYRGNYNQIRILQLTWREQRIFEYSIPSSKNAQLALQVSPPIANFTFQTTNGQGWGITYDPYEDVFYVTDGTEYLHRWNATTRQEISKVAVQYQYDNNPDRMTQPQSIRNLNELEYDPISKTVLANVWFQDVIVRIDPKTGFVQTIYDCQSLYPSSQRTKNADVFNGIALTYDILRPQSYPPSNKTNEYWVTGKYWPYMYRVRLSAP
jgi:glutamine cyclotransferase